MADNPGGGVYQTAGVVNAYNALFADNGYTGNGRPARGLTITRPAGRTKAYNSLFGTSPAGVISSASLIGVNPNLGTLAPNGGPTQTIALLSGSPAIGAGKDPINNVILFTDQRGYVPTSLHWDIGAYQSTGVPAPAPRPRSAPATSRSAAMARPATRSPSRTTAPRASRPQRSPARSSRSRRLPGSASRSPLRSFTSSSTMADPWGNAQAITVTYQITPPGGSWTSADNGTYNISLGGQSITDSGGQTIPTGTLGSFDVETGKIVITKYGLIHNPRANTWTGTIKLTNAGTSKFSGPIFVLFNLPAGTILENATGTYDGLPYLEVSVANLAAGATTSATVTFNTFVNAVSYSTSYYLGSLGS